MIDKCHQIALKLIFPCWRLLTWLLGRDVEGACVAVRRGDLVLLVKNSYRRDYSFPGGLVDSGEVPRESAVRELWEEVGLSVDPDALTEIEQIREARGRRVDRATIFELLLPEEPELTIDNREIVWAQFCSFDEIQEKTLAPSVRAYLHHEGVMQWD